MGSELGLSDEKILALPQYATSPLYSEAERVVLEYADGMTITGREVSDELFARLRQLYDDDALVELTEIIAWENASSKFNRALRIVLPEFSPPPVQHADRSRAVRHCPCAAADRLSRRADCADGGPRKAGGRM